MPFFVFILRDAFRHSPQTLFLFSPFSRSTEYSGHSIPPFLSLSVRFPVNSFRSVWLAWNTSTGKSNVNSRVTCWLLTAKKNGQLKMYRLPTVMQDRRCLSSAIYHVISSECCQKIILVCFIFQCWKLCTKLQGFNLYFINAHVRS